MPQTTGRKELSCLLAVWGIYRFIHLTHKPILFLLPPLPAASLDGAVRLSFLEYPSFLPVASLPPQLPVQNRCSIIPSIFVWACGAALLHRTCSIYLLKYHLNIFNIVQSQIRNSTIPYIFRVLIFLYSANAIFNLFFGISLFCFLNHFFAQIKP